MNWLRLPGREPILWVPPLLVLFPIWWVIGVEQIIWPLGFIGLAFWTLHKQQWRLNATPVLMLMGVFILVQLVSAFFIVEPLRFITFGRNLSMYLMALSILVVMTQSAATEARVERVLYALLLMLVPSAISGLLAFSQIWVPHFPALISPLVPDILAATGYGEALFMRHLGNYAHFTGLGEYARVKGLFLYPTHYGSALALSLPVVSYFWERKSGKWKFALAVLFGMLLINFVASTARTAGLGWLLGGLYFLNMSWTHRRRARIATATALLLGLITVLLVPGPISQAAETVLFARGSKTLSQRATIYQESINGITERPLLGWGTERDIPDFRHPAGSHSTYLGILYKHGSLGLAVFIALMVAVWRATRPLTLVPNAEQNQPQPARFLHFARWALIAALVNAATDLLDLDGTAMLIGWIVFAAAIRVRELAHHSDRAGGEAHAIS